MTIFIAILVLCIILLFTAYVWEVINDAHGDVDKTKDVFIRIGIMLITAVPSWAFADRNYMASFYLALCIHFLLFDYTINIVLWKNIIIEKPEAKNWFAYLGEKGKTDNWAPRRNMNPWKRLGVRVAFIVSAVALYIWLPKF